MTNAPIPTSPISVADRRRVGPRLLALVATAALLGSACGSSGDETSESSDRSGEDAETAFATTTEARDTSGEASSEWLEEADVAPAESADQAMEEEGSSDGSGATSGGFFADEPQRSPDSSGTNVFADNGIRQFVSAERDPLSTFALDVDTASYSVARQWISEGVRPPQESVRVEEYVNSFDYDYPAPNDGLSVIADAGPSPFDDDSIVLRLGIQAEEVADRDRPGASLTFVVDTSGSMDRSDRLGLVKTALVGLVEELDGDDTVAIVTYSDGADTLLEPTSARNADEIIEAIEDLRPNGSTNLEAGLMQGYALANDAFRRDGINRVVLASDGVANVGLTDPDGLVQLIRDDADEGIQLVTVGVGMGNFNDVVMETLANDGDGFYRYVNSDDEAQSLFTDDLVASLLTVAIDAKVQVDFDPDVVSEYRLLGYENRAVLDSDFRNDSIDAGELGAGHQVTALYELRLRDRADSLGGRDRLGTVALRWEDPDDRDVVETRLEVTGSVYEARWSQTDDDYRLAVTVAAFAESLRGSQFADQIELDEVLAEADALTESRRLDREQTEAFADLVAATRSL